VIGEKNMKRGMLISSSYVTDRT